MSQFHDPFTNITLKDVHKKHADQLLIIVALFWGDVKQALSKWDMTRIACCIIKLTSSTRPERTFDTPPKINIPKDPEPSLE